MAPAPAKPKRKPTKPAKTSPSQSAKPLEAVGPVALVAEAQATDAALSLFHPITAAWFRAVFDAPTAAGRRSLAESRP
jgi:ATP-dependent Lhr-like helicase